MNLAIVIVAYNRTGSLERLLKSLEIADFQNEDITLIISIDKSDTDVVEQFADAYIWPYGEKQVVKHNQNLGLRAHILSLGQYFDEYDAIVVLEDDITVASSFMHYVKACVTKYIDNEDIAGISLYAFSLNYQLHYPFIPAPSKYDVYFMNCAQSWGQVWMKKQWNNFKKWYYTHNEEFTMPHLPKEINEWSHKSWLKFHTRYCIEEDKYFVYPYFGLSTNNADLGTNMKSTETMYQSVMQLFPKEEYLLPDLNECEVKYDGFFEPKFLGKYLSVADDELCVDLNEHKTFVNSRRFLLTRKALPFKVVKSFALEYRPIEMNIIAEREGNDIFLYDTDTAAIAPSRTDPHRFYNYLYPKGFYNSLFIMGFKRVISLVVDLFVYKINKTFHTKFPCGLK